jgi:hypothetical protein
VQNGNHATGSTLYKESMAYRIPCDVCMTAKIAQQRWAKGTDKMQPRLDGLSDCWSRRWEEARTGKAEEWKIAENRCNGEI